MTWKKLSRNWKPIPQARSEPGIVQEYDMIIACIVLSGVVCFLTLVLYFRLQKASSIVSRSKSRKDTASYFEVALGRFLAEAIDANILAQCGGKGLTDLDVRFKEAHDRFQNVEQLVQTILDCIPDSKTQNLVQLAKYLYQLQYSLAVPVSSVRECVNVVSGRLSGSDSDQGIQIRLVQEGELVDMKYMFPLNSGSRVYQPLGIIIQDLDGKVVNKAKVLCG